MFTVAIKDGDGKYHRYEVCHEVYVYIRTLEVAICNTEARGHLLAKYPKRFPKMRENYDGESAEGE